MTKQTQPVALVQLLPLVSVHTPLPAQQGCVGEQL